MPETAIPRHFPYVTRTLMGLYDDGLLTEVASVETEPEYGYASRITYRNGATRMTYGNDVGLNPAAAVDVVKDKAYTKLFLERRGIACPLGSSFLLPWWADRIARGMAARGMHALRTADAAYGFAQTLGYPVYAKPVDGSKGGGVNRCDSAADLSQAIEEFAAKRVRVALVEKAVELPDYRLVILQGRLISAYGRTPLAVVGDGASTIGELAYALQEQFVRSGRDTVLELADVRIARCLKRQGLHTGSVPAAGVGVALHDISNLSTGGTATDVTELVAPRWSALAGDIAASFGLNFAGVDLACADIRDGAAEYSILEVNAAPGLDHYASEGEHQLQVVRDLYATVLNVAP